MRSAFEKGWRRRLEQIAEAWDSSAHEVKSIGLVEDQDRSGDADDRDKKCSKRDDAEQSETDVHQ